MPNTEAHAMVDASYPRVEKAAPKGVEPLVIDLGDALRLLWRHKVALVFWGAMSALLVAVFLNGRSPVFAARTDVMLNTRGIQVLTMESVVDELPLDGPAVDSERAILRSPALLSEVIRSLRLDLDAEFNPALEDASGTWRDGLTAFLNLLPEGVREALAPPTARTAEPEATAELVTLRRLEQAVRVDRVGLSVILRISARSSDPAKAALIANAIAERYLARQRNGKRLATADATEWLDTQLQELQGRVSEAESSVARFQAQMSEAPGDTLAATTRRISELTEKLQVIEAAVSSATARAARVRDVLSSADVADASRALSDAKLQSLLSGIDRLKSGPALAVEIAEVLTLELSRIDVQLQERLRQRRALTLSRDALLDRAQAQSANAVRLRQLEREASASRLIYETFLARFKETSGQIGLQQADARIISEARPPVAPEGPRHALLVGGAGLGGSALAYAFFLFGVAMRTTLVSSGDVWRATGLRELARLPQMRRVRRRAATLAYLRRRPNSALAEAVRKIATAVAAETSSKPGAGALIQVTSAMPNEGKSTVALLLAQSLSRSGRSVILVDADLRRPAVRHGLRLETRPDLISVLQDITTPETALADVNNEQFRVLPILNKSGAEADLLIGKAAPLLANLRGLADVVVIDAPPILAVSDPCALAPLCDQTIVVQRWRHTRAKELTQAIVDLRDADARVLGVVSNRVDPRASATEDHYGALSSYYIN